VKSPLIGGFFFINNIMPSTNFLNPSSFVMSLDSQTYSGVEFTVQSASIPDVSSEGAILSFKSVNTAMAADKITYSPLELSFLIDEDLLNYKEIYDWIKSNVETDQPVTNHVRDLTLTIMNSSNNVAKQIRFIDAQPINLSSLPFEITTVDAEYLTAVVSFQYSYYEFV
jgi:hypothetical protein